MEFYCICRRCTIYCPYLEFMIFAYIPVLIFLAYDNARRINENKRIYHGLNGLIHIAVAFGFLIFSGWQDALSLLFLTKVVFDLSLNAFRGRPLLYLPINPKSWADRLEAKIFTRNSHVAKITYIFIIICLQCLK
jgi:hypothetical protein